jgi:predicted PurR-regulated permease PerM
MSTKLPSVTSPPWSNATKRIVSLGIVIILFLLARQISGQAWTTIVLATILAYLLSPLVGFFEQRLHTAIKSYETRRTISVLLTWLIVASIFGLILGFVIPATIAQIRQFAENLPELLDDTQNDLKQYLDKPVRMGNTVFVPWDELESMFSTQSTTEQGTDATGTTSSGITGALQERLLNVANSALGLVGSMISFMIGLFLMLVMMFYLMRDGPAFTVYLSDSIPESYRGDLMRLIYEMGRVWNGYLRGQLILNMAVGVATYIVALILGLPQPLLLALIAGFLELIPNIGPMLSLVPAFILALITPSSTIPGLDAGFTYALVVALAYFMIQQLESVFLVPRIMGSNLDLHPFVVLIAILVGASLAGILGVIFAAPMVASMRVLGRYVRGKLLDEDAFPAMPTYMAQQRGVVWRVLGYFLSRRFQVMPQEERVKQSLERAGVESRGR